MTMEPMEAIDFAVLPGPAVKAPAVAQPPLGRHAASSDHGTYFYNLLQIWYIYNIYIIYI